METLLITLIVMSIILFGIPLLVQSYLHAQDMVAEGWNDMQRREEDRARTDLMVVGAQGDASAVEIILRNTGDRKLADFAAWDVIIHYYAVPAIYEVAWVPPVELAASGLHWEVAGIYMDAAQAIPEEYEPGILNPGEEMVIEAFLFPAAQGGTAGLAAITTPNGVSASTVFTIAN